MADPYYVAPLEVSYRGLDADCPAGVFFGARSSDGRGLFLVIDHKNGRQAIGLAGTAPLLEAMPLDRPIWTGVSVADVVIAVDFWSAVSNQERRATPGDIRIRNGRIFLVLRGLRGGQEIDIGQAGDGVTEDCGLFTRWAIVRLDVEGEAAALFRWTDGAGEAFFENPIDD